MFRKLRTRIFKSNNNSISTTTGSKSFENDNNTENKNFKLKKKETNTKLNGGVTLLDSNNNLKTSDIGSNNIKSVKKTIFGNIRKLKIKKKEKKYLSNTTDINGNKQTEQQLKKQPKQKPKKIKVRDLSYIHKFYNPPIVVNNNNNNIIISNNKIESPILISNKSNINNNNRMVNNNSSASLNIINSNMNNINNIQNKIQPPLQRIITNSSTNNRCSSSCGSSCSCSSSVITSTSESSPITSCSSSVIASTYDTLGSTSTNNISSENTRESSFLTTSSNFSPDSTPPSISLNSSQQLKDEQVEVEVEEKVLEKEIDNQEQDSFVDSKININSFLSEKQIQNLSNLPPIQHIFPLHETLVGIKIQDLSGNQIDFISLWENKRVVIAIFRRFGCLVCRLQALEISAIKSKLDALGISLIGIGFDPSGLDEFIEGKFFAGDIYLDVNRAIYRTLNIKRMSFWDSAVGFTDPRLNAYRKKAKEIGMPSNFKGDGMQLGGMLVIGPKPQSAHYDFRQQSFTDIFDLNKILDACKVPYPVNNNNLNDNNNNMYIPLPIPKQENITELHFSINNLNVSQKPIEQQIQKPISPSPSKSNLIAVDPLGLIPITTPTLSTRSSSTTSLNASRSTPELKSSSQFSTISTLAKSPNRYSTFVFDSYFGSSENIPAIEEFPSTNNNTNKSTDIYNNYNQTDSINNNTDIVLDSQINQVPQQPKQEHLQFSILDFANNSKFKIEPITNSEQIPSIFTSSNNFYNRSANTKMKIDLDSQKLIYNPY